MDLLTTLWLMPVLGVVIVVGVIISIRRTAASIPTSSTRRWYWRAVLVLGGVVTAVRVAICWYLTYRAYSHHESLSEVPLIALLNPEYLLAPGDPATPAGMWALTAALVAGSFGGVSILALIVWRFSGVGGRNERHEGLDGAL